MTFSRKTYILSLIVLTFSCVQETQPKTITMMVDMNQVDNPSQVGIRGSSKPLSWNSTTFMTDDNSDGIYEITFDLSTASYDIEFKFVNNDQDFELQDQSNRSLTFDYKPESIVYLAKFNNSKDITITRNE